MPARNDVTGDRIVSGKVTDNYRNNFDDIFKKDNNKNATPETIHVREVDDALEVRIGDSEGST